MKNLEENRIGGVLHERTLKEGLAEREEVENPGKGWSAKETNPPITRFDVSRL
jgi:hypothetical protein